jgi:cell pole-organizing protein PopZ
MSGAQPPPGAAGSTTAGDPSMEDILASIRRILSEDETSPSAGASPPVGASPPHKPDAEPGDGVLVLDPTMMVPEPTPVVEETHVAEPPTQTESPAVPLALPVPPVAAGLVAPEAAAAAASSVGSLMRTLASERYTQVRSGGPTIEDVVREEIRPLLKEWLDVHLPPLVERLVRVEIERVVGRAVP